MKVTEFVWNPCFANLQVLVVKFGELLFECSLYTSTLFLFPHNLFIHLYRSELIDREVDRETDRHSDRQIRR